MIKALPSICVAVVVEDPSGNILLLRRAPESSYPGMWCLPGGRLEPGETLSEGCRRELLEETGLDASEFIFLCVTEVMGPPHLIGLVYRACGISGPLRNAEPYYHDCLGWYRRDNLPAPLMPGVIGWLESELPG